MIPSRFIALGVAAALAAVGVRADGPPSPPPPESHGRLVPGQTVELEPGELPRPLGPDLRVVPPEGALYLEPPAYVYLVESRRRCEARAAAGEAVAEERGLRGLIVGIVAGLVAGAVVGALVAR